MAKKKHPFLESIQLLGQLKLQHISIYISGTGIELHSVHGVKSLGGHFACLCRGFEFYEVKKKKIVIIFQKQNGNTYFYTFNHFYSEKSSKRAK